LDGRAAAFLGVAFLFTLLGAALREGERSEERAVFSAGDFLPFENFALFFV